MVRIATCLYRNKFNLINSLMATKTSRTTMVWGWYKTALSEHPLLTKATTASFLMSLSDVLSQEVEEHLLLRSGVDDSTTSPELSGIFRYHDWERTLHVGITGLTFSGPITHVWYQLLERLVSFIITSGSNNNNYNYYNQDGGGGVVAATRVLLIQLVLDALLFSPLAVAGYFCWRSFLEHHGRLSNVPSKLKEKWAPALRASWSFWPLANVFNFSLVPLQYRVLYNNSLSLLWNAYLSNMNSRPTNDDFSNTSRKRKTSRRPKRSHFTLNHNNGPRKRHL